MNIWNPGLGHGHGHDQSCISALHSGRIGRHGLPMGPNKETSKAGYTGKYLDIIASGIDEAWTHELEEAAAL